jgi:hypothetical protein
MSSPLHETVIVVAIVDVLPAVLLERVLFSPRARLRRYLVASALLYFYAQSGAHALLNPRYAPRDPLTFWVGVPGLALMVLLFYVCAARASSRVWSRNAAVVIVGLFVLVLAASFREPLLFIPSVLTPLVFTAIVYRRVGAPKAEPPASLAAGT